MNIRYSVIPGGFPLQLGSDQAAGFDIGVRAIVSKEFDPKRSPKQRETIYAFGAPKGHLADKVIWRNNRHEFILYPGQTVNIGLGVIFEIPPHAVGYTKLVKRSSTGIANIELRTDGIEGYQRCRIADMMEDIFIDPDFRGEPIARIKNHGPGNFHIWHGRRIVQIAFALKPVLPKLTLVHHRKLSETERGHKCHGSSGH